MGGRQHQVVADDRQCGGRRESGGEPDRHGERRDDTSDEQCGVPGGREIGEQPDVRMMEAVVIRVAAHCIGSDRPQVPHRDQPDQDPHDSDRSCADRPRQQRVEPGDLIHGSSRSCERNTTVLGGPKLNQVVTVAWRYLVSRSAGVFEATQSSASSRNASWLSIPASA